MAKVKIDLGRAKSRKGLVVGTLNWANIPPKEGFIVLTHGEERDDLCDAAVKDLVTIGYATIVPVKEVAPAKRYSRSKKK